MNTTKDDGLYCGLTAVEWGILLLVVTMVVHIAYRQGYVPKRDQAQLNSIVRNLNQIEGAKEQWAIHNHKAKGALPTGPDLAPYLKDGVIPPSVTGENVLFNGVGSPVIVILARNIGKYKAGDHISVSASGP